MLRQLFRVVLTLALLVGFLVIAAFGFTALTLIVGDWFYERIWRAVEQSWAGSPAALSRDSGAGSPTRCGCWCRRCSARCSLADRAGAAWSAAWWAVLGCVFSGAHPRPRTHRPAARGARTTHVQRRALLRASRRTLGFGVAVQLCFLVPGGGIVVMAAAVAGATELARDLLTLPGACSVTS